MTEVPLVGSVATGFGDKLTAPRSNQPNIEEASQQFVSMLYSYMFQQMRESGSDEENGLFSGPHANMLMGFLDQEIGQKLAETDGSGLADALLRQMKAEDPTINVGDRVQLPGLENVGPESVKKADAPKACPLEMLTQTGNKIKEMMKKDPINELGSGMVAPPSIDNSQQIMDELYKLNRRE